MRENQDRGGTVHDGGGPKSHAGIILCRTAKYFTLCSSRAEVGGGDVSDQCNDRGEHPSMAWTHRLLALYAM